MTHWTLVCGHQAGRRSQTVFMSPLPGCDHWAVADQQPLRAKEGHD